MIQKLKLTKRELEFLIWVLSIIQNKPIYAHKIKAKLEKLLQ